MFINKIVSLVVRLLLSMMVIKLMSLEKDNPPLKSSAICISLGENLKIIKGPLQLGMACID